MREFIGNVIIVILGFLWFYGFRVVGVKRIGV